MNNNIKEILDLEIDECDRLVYIDYIDNSNKKHSLECFNSGQLLDYITNLQEENKELSRMCELYSKSLYNADLTRAEARIDKAVEYIENESWFCYKDNEEVIDRTPAETLLKILKGE